MQDLEPDGWYDEEVDRPQRLQVIFEERPPGLQWRLAAPDHVLADARLTDVDAKLHQFAVVTRRSPQRVLPD